MDFIEKHLVNVRAQLQFPPSQHLQNSQDWTVQYLLQDIGRLISHQGMFVAAKTHYCQQVCNAVRVDFIATVLAVQFASEILG